MSVSSGLMVQGDRERERARLRIVEVVHPSGAAPRRDRAAEVRLGVVACVVGPGVQVAAGYPQVDARESEGALHPGRVERIRDRQLAQLREARILDARLVDTDERAPHDIAIPVLADWGRHPGAGAHHRAVIPATLAEDLGVSRAAGFGPGRTDGALLRVFVRAVAPQRALGAVPDLPAVTDVEQAGDLKLLVTERRADSAGPVVVRVLHDARICVLQREPIRVDVQGAPGVALAYGAQAVGSPTREVDNVRGPVGNAAPQKAAAEVDTDRLAHHRYLVIEVADHDELLTRAKRQHLVAVAGPLQTDVPAEISLLHGTEVEGHLPAAILDRGRVRALREVAG